MFRENASNAEDTRFNLLEASGTGRQTDAMVVQKAFASESKVVVTCCTMLLLCKDDSLHWLFTLAFSFDLVHAECRALHWAAQSSVIHTSKRF